MFIFKNKRFVVILFIGLLLFFQNCSDFSPKQLQEIDSQVSSFASKVSLANWCKNGLSSSRKSDLISLSGAIEIGRPYLKPTDDIDAALTKYDILYHPNASQKSPLIIYFHGGGFKGGDKCQLFNTNLNFPIEELLQKNYAIATVNYRLIDNNPSKGIRTSLDDAVVALQKIRHRARQYNIDPDKILLAGSSAGSGISSWIGLQDDMKRVDKTGFRKQSTRVSALLLLETQASYDTLDWGTSVFSDEFGGLDYIDYLLQNNSPSDFRSILADFRTWYGVDDISELYSTRGIRLRKKLDMLSMLDSTDPPMYIENIKQPDAIDPQKPTTIYHHKNHALALAEKANEEGVYVMLTVGNTFKVSSRKIRNRRFNFIHNYFTKYHE